MMDFGVADTGPSRKTHASVTAGIGKNIVGGFYAIGNILPAEDLFVEELDVGRSMVREALRVLAAKGLVEPRPRRGTKVLPSSRWRNLDPDVLSWRLSSTVDRTFLRDLVDLRSMIEPAACQLASERADDVELDLIAALGRELGHDAASDDEHIASDMRFHRAILTSAHNDLLLQVSSAIDTGLRLSRDVTVGIGRGRRVEEHQEIARAICARAGARASKSMTRLIGLSLKDIVSALGTAL